QTVTAEDVDKELQKTSLYLTIRRFEPETYRRILVTVTEAIRSGKSGGHFMAVTRPFVYKVFQKYQPHASDEAILALGELITADIDAIGRKDANACYDFIFPAAAGQTVNPWEYLSPDILENRFPTIAETIETGATNPRRI